MERNPRFGGAQGEATGQPAISPFFISESEAVLHYQHLKTTQYLAG
jgi:hypothetical protein